MCQGLPRTGYRVVEEGGRMTIFRELSAQERQQTSQNWGFPGSSDGKESACNVGDPGSIPGSGRFPWRREWLPTPVFVPGEFPWREEPGGLQSMGSQRVKND